MVRVTYNENLVKLAMPLRRMRTGAPARLRVWARWLEPIERIIQNGHSMDLDWHTEDWEEWRSEQEAQARFSAMCESEEYRNADYSDRLEMKYREYGRPFFMREMLDHKRQDDHYDAVVDSVASHGFYRPVTVTSDPGTSTGYRYGDGGHRLAAAIDLGYTHIPVQCAPHDSAVTGDSGFWGQGVTKYKGDGKYEYVVERNVERSLRAAVGL